MTTGSRWISDPQWVGVGLALALRCNATASTTATTAVGEGFCESFHELPAQDSAEDCHAAIADNGACQAADEFSYGIPTGTRARQCLCDTVGSCPPSSGLDLGENGFKRMRAYSVGDCVTDDGSSNDFGAFNNNGTMTSDCISYGHSNCAANMFDGEATSIWHCGHDSPCEVWLDLGNPAGVAGMRVMTFEARVTSARVQFSLDGSSWSDVSDPVLSVQSPSPEGFTEHKFDIETAQYWRLINIVGSGELSPAIRELELDAFDPPDEPFVVRCVPRAPKSTNRHTSLGVLHELVC